MKGGRAWTGVLVDGLGNEVSQGRFWVRIPGDGLGRCLAGGGKGEGGRELGRWREVSLGSLGGVQRFAC